MRAVSSAVERFVYTEDVGGSIPSPPTMFSRTLPAYDEPSNVCNLISVQFARGCYRFRSATGAIAGVRLRRSRSRAAACRSRPRRSLRRGQIGLLGDSLTRPPRSRKRAPRDRMLGLADAGP